MKRRIKRSLLHLQYCVRGPGDGFDDVVAVERADKQRPQDEQIEGALEKGDAFGIVLSRSVFRRGCALTQLLPDATFC